MHTSRDFLSARLTRNSVTLGNMSGWKGCIHRENIHHMLSNGEILGFITTRNFESPQTHLLYLKLEIFSDPKRTFGWLWIELTRSNVFFVSSRLRKRFGFKNISAFIVRNSDIRSWVWDTGGHRENARKWSQIGNTASFSVCCPEGLWKDHFRFYIFWML